jgi:hypothetical protein
LLNRSFRSGKHVILHAVFVSPRHHTGKSQKLEKRRHSAQREIRHAHGVDSWWAWIKRIVIDIHSFGRTTVQDETGIAPGDGTKEKRRAKSGGATGKGGSGKAGKKAVNVTGHDTQVSRLMVRAIWQQQWTDANPGKTAAERGAAWKEERQALIDTDAQKMRRVLATLKRFGVTVTYTPKEDKVAEGADDADGMED